MRNLLLSIAITSTTLSCIDTSKYYIERRIEGQIRKIKSSAKDYCISIGLDFDSNDPIRTEMYHRCVYELIKQAKVESPLKPYQIYYNKSLDNALLQEKDKLGYAIEKLNKFRNNKLDNNDHLQCIKRGYKQSIHDIDTMESYYNCRRSLINTFVSTPKNLSINNSTYNTAFVINKKQDQQLEYEYNLQQKYPFCSKYRHQTKKAQQCREAFDKNKKCKSDYAKKSIVIKMRMNKACQEKLYAKLPDSLLIKEFDKKEKYVKRNFLTDMYLNPSLYDFLKNEETKASFKAKDKKGKDKSENDNKTKSLINNTNTQIYDKTELVSLRKNFIIGCTSQIDKRIENFIDRNNLLCDSQIIKWKK